MYLEHFLIPEVNETNVYLLACERGGEAMLVDAGGFCRQALERVRERELNLRYIFITHDHYDHIDALDEYMGVFPGSVVVSGDGVCGGGIARQVRDGDDIALGDLVVRALSVPGHTATSMAYYATLEREGAPGASQAPVLFSGDILFAGSVGGTIGASAHDTELDGIREKIFTLPEATLVCPGHGPKTTVGIEKRHNPFFN